METHAHIAEPAITYQIKCCRRSANGKVLWIRFEYDAVVIHSLSMGICGSLWFDLFSGVCSLSSWCFRLLW